MIKIVGWFFAGLFTYFGMYFISCWFSWSNDGIC